MGKVGLTYFDFDGGRGEDCRLALHIGGADFEDRRVRGGTWADMKATTPFGALPVLEVEGKGRLAHSNAVLGYLGRTLGLHPADPWEAARHEAVFAACEELRHQLEPTLREKDPERKKAMREEIAGGYMMRWATSMESWIGDGPFIGGDSLNVADLKLFIVLRWFISGAVDHIGVDVFDAYPKIKGLFHAVETHPGVVSWYEKRAAAARK